MPIAVFGLVFSDQIKTGARDLRLVGAALIVLGLVLYVADRTAKQRKTMEDLDTRDGVAIGFAQSLALIPGVSRSGATITAGLFLGYTREDAARFSFLLSVPAVVLSGLFELKDIGDGTSPGLAPTLIATIVSFVVGYAAIAWLLRWLDEPQHARVRRLPSGPRDPRAPPRRRRHHPGDVRVLVGSEGDLQRGSRAALMVEREAFAVVVHS